MKIEIDPPMHTEEEEEEEESEKEVLPQRKKGKVIITKPKRQPTAVFSRRTTQGK